MNTTAFVLKTAAFLFLQQLATGCKKVDIPFGNATIADPNIAYIDTISYQLSTIQSDSFITSQTGALLVGRHTDTELGTMQAESYFHLGTPGTTPLPDGALYDSAKLLVVPNGHYYGDTTAPFSLEAHLLTQQISLEGNTYFYNPQQFATEPLAIAAATVQVRPAYQDTILLPVSSPALTASLFRMLKTNSDTLLDNDHFYQFIKGISIKGTAANRAVYSLKCTDSTVMMRLYYHYTNPDPHTGYVTCKYVADNLQFNHVETNRTGTSLQSLTPLTARRISSQLTGHKSYIQNAGGLQLRIDLPYLRSFRTEAIYRKILKAELYIRPYNYVASSIYQLPAPLTLYTIGDDDVPVAVVPDKNTGQSQAVTPVIDYLYGTNTYYLFNISNYVNSVIDGAADTYNGLFLQAPAYQVNNAVNRLILADPALYKSIEVKIYRLTL